MRKRLFAFVLCLCALMCCSCAQVNTTELPELTVEPNAVALQNARTYYRNANLIIMGECTAIHTNAQGDICYDLTIAKVLAGDKQAGDTVHCTTGAMEVGRTYLLYLAEGEDVDFAEDTTPYQIVTETPLLIQDGYVKWNEAYLTVEELIADMEKASETIVAPAKIYYYSKLKDLFDACDEVFIGRVLDVPAFEELPFYSYESGASVENSLLGSVTTVRAYGSIKGKLVYGDTIKLVYAPDMAAEIMDAATLAPVPNSKNKVASLAKGQVYLFFLIQGPDSKQQYYFPVNSMQGSVQIIYDSLAVPSFNGALKDYESLDQLVWELQRED